MPSDAIEITDDQYQAFKGQHIVWDAKGRPSIFDPSSDPAILAAMFEQAIQAHLDNAAKLRGYDSIATAVSYADEPAVPRFQDDGKAFRAWRSLVWAYAYQELAKVKAGKREIPALDAFLAELPALTDPSTT
jgi:hypothetical protein